MHVRSVDGVLRGRRRRSIRTLGQGELRAGAVRHDQARRSQASAFSRSPPTSRRRVGRARRLPFEVFVLWRASSGRRSGQRRACSFLEGNFGVQHRRRHAPTADKIGRIRRKQFLYQRSAEENNEPPGSPPDRTPCDTGAGERRCRRCGRGCCGTAACPCLPATIRACPTWNLDVRPRVGHQRAAGGVDRRGHGSRLVPCRARRTCREGCTRRRRPRPRCANRIA